MFILRNGGTDQALQCFLPVDSGRWIEGGVRILRGIKTGRGQRRGCVIIGYGLFSGDIVAGKCMMRDGFDRIGAPIQECRCCGGRFVGLPGTFVSG